MARPNILFLMSDHARAGAVAAGSPCLKPNLDALAAAGTRFARCYTTNAICSPARASLMTGLYPSTHGVWDCTHTQRREWVDAPPGRFTYVSQVLADEGYRNGYFGKWHVEQSQKLETCGWHEYDLRSHVSARPVDGSALTVRTAGYPDYLLAGVADDATVTTHPAFDNGLAFMRRCVEAGRQPFCCFVSTAEPHDPYIPARRHLDRYAGRTLPLPETLRDPASDKPEVVRRMRAVWSALGDDDWRRAVTAYYATLSFLDDEVGRAVQALKNWGVYDNTLIVYTSDHGDMLGAHGLATKGVGTPYEEVYNIPLILRGPGIPAGAEDSRSCVSMVDLAPTLLDLCGCPSLPAAQGRSLRPVLEGTAVPDDWRDAYAEFYGQRFVFTQRMVWHGDWKYVFTPGGIDELYNLAADPIERHNLAADPRHRAALEDMVRRMWRKMKAIGDDSLLNTTYATLRTAPIGPRSIDA